MAKKINALYFFLVFFFGGISCYAETNSYPELTSRLNKYLWDQTSLLDESTSLAIETLLIEHDQLTGEQFKIAVLNSIHQPNLTNESKEIFKEWKVGQRGLDNGVLMTILWPTREVNLITGVGLEDSLKADRLKEIQSKFILPELKHDRLVGALVQGILETLETLQSPLIQSGKGAEILQIAGLRNTIQSPHTTLGLMTPILLFLLGACLLSGVMMLILSREAHFTRDGWRRINPIDELRMFFRNRKKAKFLEHRGTHGSW